VPYKDPKDPRRKRTQGRVPARELGILTASEVCQGDEWDSRPNSPKLLDCERCGRRAVPDFTEARRRTRGFSYPLLCHVCALKPAVGAI
jgi:hypothetical protein